MTSTKENLHNASRTVLTAWALFIVLWLIYTALQSLGLVPVVFKAVLDVVSFGVGALAAFIIVAFYLRYLKEEDDEN